MPHPNDAELTELYTSSRGSDIEDSEPNSPAPAGTPAATFDLHVEGVAGNVLGNSGSPYVLTLTAIDDTLPAPTDPTMSLTLNQAFDATNWKLDGGGTNFIMEQVFTITVPTAPSVRVSIR